jgi:hypothetical protein
MAPLLELQVSNVHAKIREIRSRFDGGLVKAIIGGINPRLIFTIVRLRAMP